MIDNYSHVENDIYYITESIPGPKEFSPEYNLLIDAFNSQITHHCECLSCSQQCSCVTMYSNETIKTKDFEPVTSFMECNDNCSCSSDCKNRTVQKGPIKNLYVKKCDNDLKGYGLFCEQVIKKGTFICEYAGEILTKSEAARRHSLNTLHNKMNYIFGLKEIVNEKIIETFIDPCTFGMLSILFLFILCISCNHLVMTFSNEGTHGQEILLCRKCGTDLVDSYYLINKLSPSAQKVQKQSMFGKQNITLQTLINPFGINFEIITSEKARCKNIGPSQGADSWFPGYTWQICVCPHCGQHIGWTFKKTESNPNNIDSIYSFHGLILNNILGENFTDSLIMLPKMYNM